MQFKVTLFTLHSFYTSLDRNRKYAHPRDSYIFSWNSLCILHEALMIDYRSWHLSEKYAAVVARKRDSPQAIVVSRVQARPIQIETREKSRYVSAFLSPSSASCYRQNSPACGNSSGIVDYRRYRWFPREIMFTGNRDPFVITFPFVSCNARRTDAPVRRAGSRSFSSAEKAGGYLSEKNEERPIARDSCFIPDPAAPRRRIRTGRTRP